MIFTFRPESTQDETFIRSLVIETISAELMADAWPQPMRDHLLDMQYVQRRGAARLHYPGGESRIILADGVNAGWIYVADLGEELWVAEIMVTGEYRNRGLGSEAIRHVIAKAGVSGRPVRLRVNITNVRAGRFYERLGFRRIGGDELQDVMQYRSSGVSA